MHFPVIERSQVYEIGMHWRLVDIDTWRASSATKAVTIQVAMWNQRVDANTFLYRLRTLNFKRARMTAYRFSSTRLS